MNETIEWMRAEAARLRKSQAEAMENGEHDRSRWEWHTARELEGAVEHYEKAHGAPPKDPEK
jgi:hypothetical protein